jgi:hypothetical protein
MRCSKMVKTLTISAYNRPADFAQVIRALAWCDGVGEYDVVAVLDPSDKTQELAEIAKAAGIQAMIMQERLGCGSMIRYCMELGFQISDFHIHLEDDTVPSVDCLRWFEWAQRNAPATILTISGYNQHGGDAAPNTFGIRNWFTPWGWGTWRERFNQHLARAWDSSFWDGGVQRVRERLGMFEMYPRVSRIQNIGAEGGTFCPGPEFHKENQHAKRVTMPEEKQTTWITSQ